MDYFLVPTVTELEDALGKVVGKLADYNKYRNDPRIEEAKKEILQVVSSMAPTVWAFVLSQLKDRNESQYLGFSMGENYESYKVTVEKVDFPKEKNLFQRIFKIK